MALSDNLVSYWKFDESSGNAADSVGSNTLTNNNTVTYSAGKINNGANFVGSSSKYFTSPSMTISAAFSFSFWFKGDGTQYDHIFNHQGTDGTNTIVIAYVSDNKITYSNFVAGIASSTTFTNNTWTHIVITNDGSNNGKIYQNGSEVASGTINHSSLSAVLNVGRRSNGSQYFDGSLDEVGLWSRAITSTEVTALYNSGNGLAYPFGNAYTLSIGVGAFTLTGIAALFNRGRNMVASAGTFTLTGIAALFKLGKGIFISTGNFILTGYSATLRASNVVWTNISKSTSTWTNRTKNTSTWSNETKSSSIWTNKPKS